MYIWRASQAPHYGRRGAGDAQTAPVSQHSNVVRGTQGGRQHGDSSEYLTSEGDWNDNIRTTCGLHIPSSAPCLCESLMIILVLDFGSKLARSKL